MHSCLSYSGVELSYEAIMAAFADLKLTVPQMRNLASKLVSLAAPPKSQPAFWKEGDGFFGDPSPLNADPLKSLFSALFRYACEGQEGFSKELVYDLLTSPG